MEGEGGGDEGRFALNWKVGNELKQWNLITETEIFHYKILFVMQNIEGIFF